MMPGAAISCTRMSLRSSMRPSLSIRVSMSLGRPILVENRTGGSGRIGVMTVKNAAADGSTLLVTPIAPMAVYQHTYRSLGYDPIIDFAPVTQLATFDF